MTTSDIDSLKDHPVVSHEEWLDARRALLEKEKAFTRQGDELSQLQRDLPWEVVAKAYKFDGPTLRDPLARERERAQYFLQGPARHHLSYLFVLRPRKRQAQYPLSLSRSGAQGTRRRRSRPLLGSPPGRVRSVAHSSMWLEVLRCR
jgi:hypothetical protein